MKTEKAYKFRIYPNKHQEILINKTFGCVRFVWNQHVAHFNSYDKNTKTYTDGIEKLTTTIMKNGMGFDFLNEVSATTLQQKERDFIDTKVQFFNKKRKTKIGRPKFKKKGMKDSFRILGNNRFSLNQQISKIRLEKIGHVKVVIDRKIPESVEFRNVTISRNKAGQYFASILVREEIKPKETTGKVVGIDLGFIDLVTTSGGTKITNPKVFRKNQTKLKRKQRKLRGKKLGSKRYLKAKYQVAKLYNKMTNKRKWLNHNISSALVNNYDVICMEDLNLAGMKQRYGKSVNESALGDLTRMIEYKCNWYGRTFHKVDRFFASSKTCSSCGMKTKLELSDRDWICPHCKTHHDRDFNAATNILKRGLTDLFGFTSDELVEVIGRGNVAVSLFGPMDRIATTVVDEIFKYKNV